MLDSQVSGFQQFTILLFVVGLKNELISCLRYWVLLMSSVKPFYFHFNGKYCLNCRLREILEYFSFFFKQVETKPEKHFAFTKELKKKRGGGGS